MRAERTSSVLHKVPPAVLWLAPLAALALMLWFFLAGGALRLAPPGAPPAEELAIQRIEVIRGGLRVHVVNAGPAPVTVAQVAVDDAFWTFEIEPSATLPRLERATLTIPYPWVRIEPVTVTVISSTGLTFSGAVEAAVLSPDLGLRQFLAYGLIGVYVGVVPVGLGMLWFPALRRLGRRGLGAILSLTLGLLVFLLVDTGLEAIEVGAEVPGVFQGIPLAAFAALATWLGILAAGRRKAGESRGYIAGLIALGIGLHNLGEGLAIGAAYALGSVALGSFLVVGFTLHNITDGVGIVSPLLSERPGLRRLIALALLAGAPAVLGTWIGGFAFSPVLATAFLGVGIGAIWQVIVEVFGLLRRQAQGASESPISWLNLGGFVAGILIMYLTAFLVS